MTLARLLARRAVRSSGLDQTGAPSASSRRARLFVAACVVSGLALPGAVLAQDAGPNSRPATCYEGGANFVCGAIAAATGNDSTVVGALATATRQGTAALGWNAHATGLNSTALGSSAAASGEASVALGTGSVADQDYTVSLGDRDNGLRRRIVNMADGIDDNDGATVGQMNAGDAATLLSAAQFALERDAELAAAAIRNDELTLRAAREHADAGDARTLAAAQAYADLGDARTLASANAYTDAQLLLVGEGLEAVRERADSGTAAAIAAANIPQAFAPGRTMVGAGLGYWRGEGALSIGASHLMSSGRITFRGSATFAQGGGSGGGVGVGFSF